MCGANSKVYCVQCAYFNSCKRTNSRVSYDDFNVHETCNAPQNIRSSYLSDGSNKYISSPCIINKFNNCKWFCSKSLIDPVTANIDLHNKDQKSHPYLVSKINELDNREAQKDAQIEYNLNAEIERAKDAEDVLANRIDITIADNKPILTDKDGNKFELIIVDGEIKTSHIDS